MEEIEETKIGKREKIALHLILFALSMLIHTKYSHQVNKPIDAIKEILGE